MEFSEENSRKSKPRATLLKLPDSTADAFTNMADDLLLLDHFPWKDTIRFRHYSWKNRAVTFGYGQKFEEVFNATEAENIEICRRPTGGGIVDHEKDWTYSLVIPPVLSAFFRNPVEVYRVTHEALATALSSLGQSGELLPPLLASAQRGKRGSAKIYPEHSEPSICFEKPEPSDVVSPTTRQKISGAALKRNRHGLLLQGSVAVAAAPQLRGWSDLASEFSRQLCQSLHASEELTPAPPYPQDTAMQIRRHFRSREWNQRR